MHSIVVLDLPLLLHSIVVLDLPLLLQVSVKSDKFEDPCKDPKYVEPAVDSMRAQKEEVTDSKKV